MLVVGIGAALLLSQSDQVPDPDGFLCLPDAAAAVGQVEGRWRGGEVEPPDRFVLREGDEGGEFLTLAEGQWAVYAIGSDRPSYRCNEWEVTDDVATYVRTQLDCFGFAASSLHFNRELLRYVRLSPGGLLFEGDLAALGPAVVEVGSCTPL